MKKITTLAFTLILAVMTACAFPTTTTSATNAQKQLGDVDSDGLISSSDASIVLHYYTLVAIGKTNEAANLIEDISFADVDSDGTISSIDASYILSYYAKISVGETPTWPNQSSFEISFQIGDQYAYIGSETIWLTPAPSDDVLATQTLSVGERFSISEICGNDWVQITFPKCPTELYLKISDIESVADLELCYRPETVQVNTQWRFIGKSWNIRTGASTDYPSTGKYLKNGDIITVLAVYSDNWVEIADGEYVLLDKAQFSLI